MRGDILKQYIHKGEIRHGKFNYRPKRQRKDTANDRTCNDYPDILTLEEFVGFLYGMVAGNHDIETIFIDSVLKQANITLESLPVFLQKLSKISSENNIDFYLSIGADKKEISGIDSSDYNVIS